MKTVIRLQNHGVRNHPYWWIVIMGKYRSPKGRFVEHVGYWIPRKTRSVQRSVVLNKPRLRYWLAMGAQPSKKIAAFLSWVDMWPTPPILYGSKTLYKKKPIEGNKPEFYEVTVGTNFHGEAQNKFYEKRREIEEQNLFTRKMQIQNELEKQVTLGQLREIDKETDIHERTKKFYELREKLHEYERDVKKLPSGKRDQLYREMNERAEKGILPEKSSPKPLDLDLALNDTEDVTLNPKESKKKEESPEGELLSKKIKKMEPNENLIKNQMLYMKYMEDAKEKVKEMQETLHSLKPATQEDVVSILNKQFPNATPKEIQEKAKIFWKLMKETALIPSKQDIQEWTLKPPKIHSIKQIYKDIDSKTTKVYIPTPNPVNPFPDITRYDPNDYHEVSLNPLAKINHNKAYDLPGVDDLKLNNGTLQRGGKSFTPRKPRRRTGFCSLQKELASINCSFYSFVLRQIEAVHLQQKA